MRTKTRSLLLTIVMIVTVQSGQAEDAALAKAALKDKIEQVTPGDNHRDLVILQFARELGLLEGVSAQSVAAAVDARRTDQQLTASSSTPGSVTKVEKPGIAELLAIAIERGAVKKETAETNVTLSTTPYMFLTGLGSGDTPDNWESLAWARRIAFSSTFSSENVTNGDFSSFVSGQVKVVLGGNRSGRDAAILRNISSTRLMNALAPHGVNCRPFLDSPAGQAVTAQARAFDNSLVAAAPADVEARLQEIVDPATVPMDDDTRAKLIGCLAGILNLQRAIIEDTEQLKVVTDAYLAFNSKNQLSSSFLYQRDPETSDFTVLKLLYARDATAYTISLNGEISFNQHGQNAAGANLDRIRAYSVEGGMNSKKMAGGRADATLSAKWYDPKSNDAGYVLSAQALLNLHLNATMKFPVALTYANRTLTDANAKEGLQIEFGVAALLDNLFAAASRH